MGNNQEKTNRIIHKEKAISNKRLANLFNELSKGNSKGSIIFIPDISCFFLKSKIVYFIGTSRIRTPFFIDTLIISFKKVSFLNIEKVTKNS